MDYFGFEGTYDPSLANSGGFEAGTGDIKLEDSAFGGRGNSYSRLRAIYEEELYRSKDYLTYKSKIPVGISFIKFQGDGKVIIYANIHTRNHFMCRTENSC